MVILILLWAKVKIVTLRKTASFRFKNQPNTRSNFEPLILSFIAGVK